MNIICAYPIVIIGGIFFLILTCLLRKFFKKMIRYKFPMTSIIQQKIVDDQRRRSYVFMLNGVKICRYGVFILLIGAAARFQVPDEASKRPIEGLSIMLVMDVSGSMECFDDLDHKQSRFSVAQQEAISFIEKRPHDLIGITLFGAVAIARCPLTADHRILKQIIQNTSLGIVSPEGTVLGLGISMGVRRLFTSPAKSKIMVVLTDGEPTPGDIDIQIPLNLAKKIGVKIYTIGIGNLQGGYIDHPWGGIVQVPTPLNELLLKKIAQETGGKFFHATDQKELHQIYKQIDTLEKSTHEIPQYEEYWELSVLFLMGALLLLLIEGAITSYFWIAL